MHTALVPLSFRSRAGPACSTARSAAPPVMMGAKTDFFKKLIGKKEDKQVTDFRSQLAGMESLSGLSEMSLERESGKEGRTVGEWKEYIKNDGRKWCAPLLELFTASRVEKLEDATAHVSTQRELLSLNRLLPPANNLQHLRQNARVMAVRSRVVCAGTTTQRPRR